MKLKNTWALFILILVFQLILLINLKFTAWPEMTLWPYLIAKGWLPYRDIAIAHTPLMPVLLSIVYKIFGVGILQLKIFTWILILGIDVLVFAIAKKLWNQKVAFLSLISYCLLLVFYDGNGLWFDLFMGVFALVCFYFVQKKNYLWAGIFWGLAFISKQTAVWLLIPIALEIVQSTKYLVQRSARFLSGSLVILVLLVILLLLFGILPDFWNWAVKFGIFILPKARGQVQLPDLKNLIVSAFPFLVFLPLFISKAWPNRNLVIHKSKFLNLFLWAMAGCLGAYPRFEYFHFQPALPFLAIAFGLVFAGGKTKNKLIKIFIPIYLIGCLYLFTGYFMRNFREGVRFYEKDVENISLYVKSHTRSSDTIFVMNWWDNIYALSDRLPATFPWVPQLSWYIEMPDVQEMMVDDLKTSKPKLIIMSPYTGIGLSAYIPQKVYNYVIANYVLKEKIDGIYILMPKNNYEDRIFK